ncbi:helix-turn-helix domain-containing protein [Paenibacillus glucanolyticus]|uniref:helix-turn-helix domain-containing protein n=1 Tax=Paenibacillus glucanolyticus TaxID=59843 RepID=UPI0034CE7924
MFIHRNTFIYRVDKIKELLNSNFKNRRFSFVPAFRHMYKIRLFRTCVLIDKDWVIFPPQQIFTYLNLGHPDNIVTLEAADYAASNVTMFLSPDNFRESGQPASRADLPSNRPRAPALPNAPHLPRSPPADNPFRL